jgi:hypothetical protein
MAYRILIIFVYLPVFETKSETQFRKGVGLCPQAEYQGHHCAVSYTVQSTAGQAVVRLVEALSYKPEGSGFDSRWCHWNYSLTQSFRPHYGTGVDSACNINDYQVYFLGGKEGWCVGLTSLSPPCADCLGVSASWIRQSLSITVIGLLQLL